MQAFGAFVFIAMFFLPAVILLYFAWAVWIANPRPEIAKWRLSTFKWGLVFSPLSMAAQIPGGVHYLGTWGPPNWFLGTLNGIGLLLWSLSFAAAFTGQGWARGLLCCWAILAMLGLLAIYMMVP